MNISHDDDVFEIIDQVNSHIEYFGIRFVAPTGTELEKQMDDGCITFELETIDD